MDFRSVANLHAEFVFKTLQRLRARPEDLDDLMQEVFIVVHHNLHKYDPSKPIEPWLRGICKNILARHRRKAGKQPETGEETMDTFPSAETNPDEQFAAKQMKAELGELLATLDDEQYELIVMYEIDGMSCKDIAEVLGVPLGTVHSRLHTAREDLKKAHARLEARRNHSGGRR